MENKFNEIIDEVTEMHPYKDPNNRSTYNQYNEGWSDACDILGERLKKENSKQQAKLVIIVLLGAAISLIWSTFIY